MWSTVAFTPLAAPHSLTNWSYHVSYDGTKWLHSTIFNSLSAATALRTKKNGIVSAVAPAPASRRNLRREATMPPSRAAIFDLDFAMAYPSSCMQSKCLPPILIGASTRPKVRIGGASRPAAPTASAAFITLRRSTLPISHLLSRFGQLTGAASCRTLCPRLIAPGRQGRDENWICTNHLFKYILPIKRPGGVPDIE